MEYDGTDYNGFQLQADLPTIQGELERSLKKFTGETMRVMAASRTDSGVHAKGQVVSFRTFSTYSPDTFVKAINHYLPVDISVKFAYRVNDGFDVRGDPVSREYCYYIMNRPCRSPIARSYTYFVPGELDVEAMNRACRVLVGEHDFSSFITDMQGRVIRTIRTVYKAEVKKEEELVTFNMVANSFLPHQVRNTVGALVKVGLGRMRTEEFDSMMRAKRSGLAGPTAPACGLCLVRVNYAKSLTEL